jgi:hypothetical protein
VICWRETILQTVSADVFLRASAFRSFSELLLE